MNKTTAWVLIAVAFLIGGAVGYLAARQRAIDNMEAYKLQVQNTLDQVKMDAEKAAMEKAAVIKTAEVVLTANDEKLGAYKTGTNGMTLYTFDSDKDGKSSCTGQCAVNWPPYTAEGTVPSNLQENVGTTERSDGAMQYTWKGAPVYFYIKDAKQGDILGDGVNKVWHVAK